MILILLGILLLLIGIILLIVPFWDNYREVKQVVGLYLTIFGVIVGITCTCICLQNKPHAVYENIQVERRMLQYELDMLNDMTDADANVSYEHIIKFNNKLMLIKEGARSPWTSWLYSSKIADDVSYVR